MRLSIYSCKHVGTHGTGVEFGNLATLVTRLELITGDGSVLTLSASDNPETFKAAQVYFVNYHSYHVCYKPKHYLYKHGYNIYRLLK